MIRKRLVCIIIDNIIVLQVMILMIVLMNRKILWFLSAAILETRGT